MNSDEDRFNKINYKQSSLMFIIKCVLYFKSYMVSSHFIFSEFKFSYFISETELIIFLCLYLDCQFSFIKRNTTAALLLKNINNA